MLIAALVYLAGFRDYAEDTPLAAQESVAPLTRAEVRMLAMIVMMLVLATIPFFAYDQGSNAGMIWISDKVDLATPFGDVPVAWFNSIDPLASILSVPLLLWIWQRRAARGKSSDDIVRIALGAFLVFLAGADAFVSAHLMDFPAPLEAPFAVDAGLSPVPGATAELRFKVPLGR